MHKKIETRKAKKMIKDNLYMTIAVASREGSPWIANLYYAFDRNYNFYWYSPADSVHSIYIRENPEIAISIFDSTAVGDDADGVYIKAKAYEVDTKKELLKCMLLYGKKMLNTGFVDSIKSFKSFVEKYQDFKGKSELRMYKAVAEEVYKLRVPSRMYNDKFVDSRVKVNLI